jgi:hypothetical protein
MMTTVLVRVNRNSSRVTFLANSSRRSRKSGDFLQHIVRIKADRRHQPHLGQKRLLLPDFASHRGPSVDDGVLHHDEHSVRGRGPDVLPEWQADSELAILFRQSSSLLGAIDCLARSYG